MVAGSDNRFSVVPAPTAALPLRRDQRDSVVRRRAFANRASRGPRSGDLARPKGGGEDRCQVRVRTRRRVAHVGVAEGRPGRNSRLPRGASDPGANRRSRTVPAATRVGGPAGAEASRQAHCITAGKLASGIQTAPGGVTSTPSSPRSLSISRRQVLHNDPPPLSTILRSSMGGSGQSWCRVNSSRHRGQVGAGASDSIARHNR